MSVTITRRGETLQVVDGFPAVGDVLPAKLYDTAYALGVEVAAADLHVEKEELRILQLLRDRFKLDKLTVAAIERGAIARHRTI